MTDHEVLQKPLPIPTYPITRYNSGVLLGWYFRLRDLTEARHRFYLKLLDEGLPCRAAYAAYLRAKSLYLSVALVLKKRGEI